MAYILATEHALPENVIDNQWFTEFMDTSDEWIQTRSGIKQRRWVRKGNQEFKSITNHELVFEATKRALDSANLKASDIDLICYATISADNEMPGSGVYLQRLLALENIPVIEIRNQCSGFMYALQTARAFIQNDRASNVLVVGAEIQSTGLDLSTEGRNTTVLFADGAGVVLLGKKPVQGHSPELLNLSLHSDGANYDKLGIRYPGYARNEFLKADDFSSTEKGIYPFMDGKFVFKNASVRMPEVVRSLIRECGFAIEDLKLVIPHQANQRIIEMLAHDLGPAVRVFSNISQYGNTTAASIPIALSEANKQGLLKVDELVCLVSFGAGFSWGAALIKC